MWCDFKANGNLKQHIKSVYEGKEIKCDNCTSNFTEKCYLKTPIESVCGGKLIKCEFCPSCLHKKVTWKKYWIGAKYKICSLSFTMKIILKKYITSVHGGKTFTHDMWSTSKGHLQKLAINENSKKFCPISWNLVKIITSWGNHFHQVS